MDSVALSFTNASCAHCACQVTRTLEKVDGVQSVEVDRADLLLFVDFDPAVVCVESLRDLLEKQGYPTQVVDTPVARFAKAT